MTDDLKHAHDLEDLLFPKVRDQKVSKLVLGFGSKLNRFPYRCMPTAPNRRSTKSKKIAMEMTVFTEPSTCHQAHTLFTHNHHQSSELLLTPLMILQDTNQAHTHQTNAARLTA